MTNEQATGVQGGRGPSPQPIRAGRPAHRYHEMRDKKGHRSMMATVAGILLVITGVLGLVIAVFTGAVAVMISNSDVDSVNLTDGQFCSVLGQVTNERGEPLSDATVTLVDHDLHTTSDEGGIFCLVSIEPGIYTIEVKKEGYTTQMFETYLLDNNNINYSEYQDLKDDWEYYHYEYTDYYNDDYTGGYSDTHNDYYYDSSNYNDNDYSMDEETFERNHNFFNVRLNPGTGMVSSDYTDEKKAVSGLANPCTFCFAIIAISSIITLGGGVAALLHRSFVLTIVGCVAGIFTMAFPLNILLCVIAFILLIVSYEHFYKKKA